MAKRPTVNLSQAMAELAAMPHMPDKADLTTQTVEGRPDDAQFATHNLSGGTGNADLTTRTSYRGPDNVHRAAVVDAPMLPNGAIARVRYERPHVSVYAHPAVFEVVKDLARTQRRKAHDLYLDGLRMLLAHHGYDFDKLNRGG